MNPLIIPFSSLARHRMTQLCLTLLIVCIVFTAPGQVSAATTEIRVVKYAVDEYTILAEKTVDYRWMEQILRVYGDGITHYYHQGPVFVDDPDPAREEELRWNPAEDTNVQEKDMGAVRGTNLMDLCNLVGGMEPGDKVKIRSSDGWSKMLAYENVYEYSGREGPIIICWFKDGQYPDTGYTDGMRMVWFADTSTNPWGIHAFGNWDWHEAAESAYWYYHAGEYPTTTGLSGQLVSEILIYSHEEPAGSIDVTSTPAGADILLDGVETGEVTPFQFSSLPAGSYTVGVRMKGYLLPDEEWVDVSHGTVIPVHFDLEQEFFSSSYGTSDSPLTDGFADDWEQGSLGVTVPDVKGNISIKIADGGPGVCMSGQTLTYRIEADSLPLHPSTWARLYIFSQEGYTNGHDLDVRIHNVKAGIPDRFTYYHSNGKVSETLAFNVTPMVEPAGAIEVSIRNPPGGNEWTIFSPVLLIAHEDGEGISRESAIAEGASSIHATKEYSHQDTQNITISDFSAIPPGHSDAEFIVIGTATKGSDALTPMVLQNSVMIPGVLSAGLENVWITRFNATSTVSGFTHNEFFWKTADPDDTAELETRLAVLTLAYPEKTVSAEYHGEAFSAGEPVQVQPAADGQNVPASATYVPESSSTEVPGIEPVGTTHDEYLLSRIWRIIFWIFGVQFPEQGAGNSASGVDFPHEIPDEENRIATSSMSSSSITYPLYVTTIPQGAALSLSGFTGTSFAPATFTLPQGDYVIEAEMDGYAGCRTLVHLTGARNLSLVLPADERGDSDDSGETAARSRHGGLLVITYPGNLELSVDNILLESRSPLVLYGLKEGSHTVQATRPGTTGGRGESMRVRAWVYHDALSICEMDFVAPRLDRRVRITSPSGNSTPFTLNGRYPQLRSPVTLDLPGTGSYITLSGEGTYTSIPVPDGLATGNDFVLPEYSGFYHSIAIESDPMGAEIFIDGIRTGNTTPSLVRGLSEGSHLVMVSLPGYMPVEKRISIPRTDDVIIEGPVSFILETYPCGILRVESNPEGATIHIDNIASGEKTPFTFTGIPVGVHELTLISGEIRRTRDITIRPDSPNRYFVGLL